MLIVINLKLCPHSMLCGAIDVLLFMKQIKSAKNGNNGMFILFSHRICSIGSVRDNFLSVLSTVENISRDWKIRRICIFHNEKLKPLYLSTMWDSRISPTSDIMSDRLTSWLNWKHKQFTTSVTQGVFNAFVFWSLQRNNKYCGPITYWYIEPDKLT